MIAKTFSAAVNGIDADIIEVEVYISSGSPSITIVGLPDAAVKESKDRVVAAIKNSGFDFPYQKKIVANLAPADLKKEGGAFDLPLALALLAAVGRIQKDKLSEFCIIGELSLEGKIRKGRGLLSIALGLQKNPLKKLLVPFANRQESAIVKTIEVFPFKTLAEAAAFINEELALPPFVYNPDNSQNHFFDSEYDFSDIKGQRSAKRAAEISAAGGHNMIMSGPPGAGKTMLAKRIPSILPPMTFEESVETTKIHSACGQNFGGALIAQRPFRSPHHTSSAVALAGGGVYPKPGEISLAHNGVLFLDEFAEFRRDALEILRQPLEDRRITVSRAKTTISFPASFMLVAAMNPCPCGNFGSYDKECACSAGQILRYKNKISGPLLDRIDIHIEVPALRAGELADWTQFSENSQTIRGRIIYARQIQNMRFKGLKIFSNAQMNVKDIRKYCVMDEMGKQVLKRAIEKLKFSARAYDKILKVSRTIADLDKSALIKSVHIAEAVQYRSFDRM
ncbi:MAG: YifB family Mg chelatase-like AAA ATPase [Elusimicrobiota bacterium]|nr:YifB family Mg chelatase-like AAA ATPase [Elusimicrobiota bacterium]